MSQEELAAAAREAGAGDSMTGTVVGFMESGRRREGRRTRLFTLDELLPLAAALEVSPLELLGSDSAELFVGESSSVRVECPSCLASPGPVETVTRADLGQLGELSTLEPTLVETAYRLAAAIDEASGEAAKALPALTRELRATVQELSAGRRRKAEPDDDDFGDLDEPE
jgi:hypothetical protein